MSTITMECDREWWLCKSECRKGGGCVGMPMEAEEILKALRAMTPEQRMEIMEGIDWCKHCGGELPCSCWNDE